MDYITFMLNDFVKHHLSDDIVILNWWDFKGWQFIAMQISLFTAFLSL